MIVANAKLQIFGDLPKGLSPFLSAQFNFLSDTNNIKYGQRGTDNNQVQRNEGESQRGVRPGRSDLRRRNNEQEGLERETEGTTLRISSLCNLRK